MNPAPLSNLILWSAQAFLALFFFLGSIPKLLGRGLERWTGFSDVPRGLVVCIGIAEVLGAAGLVLPMAMGVMPWLTPLAAVGLAVVVLMASGFHQRANEYLEAVETALWAGIAAVIAVGRWELLAARADVRPWMLAAALGLLVPAVVVNLAILLRRPVRGQRSRRGSAASTGPARAVPTGVS
jgi:hypothetical protein